MTVRLVNRFRQRLIAIAAAAALVFAQGVVAAHACMLAAAQSMPDADAMPCHGGAAEHVGLCKVHCQVDQQSVDQGKSPVAGDVGSLAFVTGAFHVGAADLKGSARIAHASEQPGAPPLRLMHCCFRN
jgi:hypothetical protein